MRIKSTHTNLLENWDVSNIWGMITVESFESAPRWICSTVVPFDNDTANPLIPLSGLLITIVYLAPNVAVLECYFNPDLINISNGVKITAKIKAGRGGNPPNDQKLTSPLNEYKGESQTNASKTTAP